MTSLVLLSVLAAATASPPWEGGEAVAAAADADRSDVSRVAPTPPVATFALAIGVNRPLEPDQLGLRYADDDAAQYFTLFRSLGARAYLVATLDENTARLHPQAAAEAHPATRSSLARVAAELAQDVRKARAAGMHTALYLTYAGHGALRQGVGTLQLDEGALRGEDLVSAIIDPIRAEVTHLIVDACDAYLVAYSRGPGGHVRALAPASSFGSLADRDDVGLLLSTSAARQSHEWEAFEAGVFSHEVRSGLMGAADADADGEVSYTEIGAFVERANAAVPSERFRPQAHARPPRASEVLVDLRGAPLRRLRVDAGSAGRYYLETSRGVRLLDLHSAAGQSVDLVLPGGQGLLFVRKPSSDEEYALPAEGERMELSSLAPRPSSVRVRGAAHESFGLLFALPFDGSVVQHYRAQALPLAGPRPAPDLPRTAPDLPRPAPDLPRPAPDLPRPAPDLPRPAFAGASPWARLGLGAGVAMLLGGGFAALSAADIRSEAPASESQAAAAERNERIASRNRAAAVLLAAGGAGLATSIVLLRLGGEDSGVLVQPVAGPSTLGLMGVF